MGTQTNGFEIITHTSIPANQAELVSGNGSDGTSSEDLIQALNITVVSVDIGPSGIAGKNLVSDHSISLFKIIPGPNQAPYDFDPDLAFDALDHVEVTPVYSASPQATWNKEIALNPELSKVNGKPLNITGTLVGFSLKGKMITPDSLPPIDVSHLQYEYADKKPRFAWSDPKVKTVDPDPGKDGTTVLMGSINDPTVSARRKNILEALAGQGMAVNTTVDVSDLASGADTVLLESPELISWQPV